MTARRATAGRPGLVWSFSFQNQRLHRADLQAEGPRQIPLVPMGATDPASPALP